MSDLGIKVSALPLLSVHFLQKIEWRALWFKSALVKRLHIDDDKTSSLWRSSEKKGGEMKGRWILGKGEYERLFVKWLLFIPNVKRDFDVINILWNFVN